VGSVVIIILTFGGNSWGVPDLALWSTAGGSVQPALDNGLVGIAAAPLISALVVRLPLRALLRGPVVEALEAP
jgi:hypothetical protein